MNAPSSQNAQNVMAQKTGAEETKRQRRESFASNDSQTASDFIDSQLRLEADAREALPYASRLSFDSCTQPLGALRQSLFSCLTCNPPPSDPNEPYNAAGVCYSCSISCHGEHTLVELFSKRNFVCDCGTTRLPSTSPCTLRTSSNGSKGVHSEKPAAGNKYNGNFRNIFCSCAEAYDPHQEKGTMFQCLGLGNVEDGGCGEDWYHPECLVGIPRNWAENVKNEAATEPKCKDQQNGNAEPTAPAPPNEEAEDEPPLPPGFPDEDDFEAFICYRCLDANPWLKQYAGTPGFLPAIYKKDPPALEIPNGNATAETTEEAKQDTSANVTKKRKAEDNSDNEPDAKRPKEETSTAAPVESQAKSTDPPKPKHESLLASAPTGTFSLFLKEDFRDYLCHCPTCFPKLIPHPQLREEEETYEPPLSEAGDDANGGGSHHTGSLLDRGEAALSNVDRVRAIEGVMVYNHLKDKVKEFLKPFAESGQAVGAEDIKAYFENLRGDDQGISEAGGAASASGSRGGGGGGGGDKEDGGDSRREQSGKFCLTPDK
ncbi:hypothetical protein AJ79_00456 [Helicocarpus griseus UAMH5409]|uniref:UBR-type domain-containing protein n=1 Tax=Helicocarpus griseus UAMH5409 TaxID=1447875 RepID=A0A2B7YBC1_9EURO|nr:hypothetical protein AJ79_00456 [Helicocarpus griseus UAMH5409]